MQDKIVKFSILKFFKFSFQLIYDGTPQFGMVSYELPLRHDEPAAASGTKPFIVNTPVGLFAVNELRRVSEDNHLAVAFYFVLYTSPEVAGITGKNPA